MTLIGSNPNTVRNYAACACLFLWVKLFYFFRIFDNTALLVKMIQHICADMVDFTIMLVLAITAFSNGLYLLNMNRTTAAKRFIFKRGDDSLLMTFIYTYTTGMGNYLFDEFKEGDNAALVWIVFLMLTITI
jgi:hypothetical protein